MVEDWLVVEEDGVKYPGLEMSLALKGKAFEMCKHLAKEELKKKTGSETIFNCLEKHYKKDTRLDKMEKAMNLYRIEREQNESAKEYVFWYEKYSDKCTKAGGEEMSAEMKGAHLLRQVNFSDMEKHIVLGACGDRLYDYTNIREQMIKIFQEERKREDVWAESDKKKNGRILSVRDTEVD